MMPPRTTVIAALLATVLTLTGVGTPVQATPSPTLQTQIDRHLQRFPGGRQINATEIAYQSGAFVITFTKPDISVNGAADCPAGWFCFYEHTNFGYPRGRLSSCGWQDLAWWGWHDRTESVHNNQSSGSVVFVSHTGPSDHSGDYDLFGLSRWRSDSDVAPYRNMADHVYRSC